MRLRDRWNRRDWLVLIGLLAVTVLVWSRVLFCRQWSFGVELDFLRQFFPARFFAARSLSSGVFPLWSPYALSGYPFFASYQSAMLYPFNLLMVGAYGAAGADFTLKAQCAFVVFHFFLAGAFTYVLARDLKIGRAGATVAALTYMTCGYMVAHAGHINQLSASAWIPLVFLLFRRCLEGRRISYAVGAGAALGVALLAGHFQPLFYLCLLLLAFVVYTAVRRVRGDPRKPGLLFGLGALGVTVAVAAGLAAAQLLPTYQMIRLSGRESLPYGLAATYSLPRRELITLIFPHFMGRVPEEYFGFWAPLKWEVYGYAGIAGGALGVLALLRRRKGLAVFLWVVALLSVVLALGPGGYLWTALFRSHLFFNSLRDPGRIFVIYGFAMALLAGLGADHVQGTLARRADRPRYRAAFALTAVMLALVVILALALAIMFVGSGGSASEPARRAHIRSALVPVAVLAGLLLILYLAGRFRGLTRALPFALIALVLVDLAVLNVPWTMVRINPEDPLGDRAVSEYVARLPGEFRVETDANTMYVALDDGALYGIEKASGDDSLVLADYDRYRELITPSVAPGVQLGLFHVPGVRSPLLDIMNDVYFLSRDRLDPTLAAGKFELVRRVGGVYVYENTAALPRAWIADGRVVADSEQAYEALASTGGEGLAETAVVVEGGQAGPRAGERIRSSEGGVRVLEHGPNRLLLETEPECRGLLVVSEVFYPGWEAYVDGRRTEILRTNFLFRGVLLEGGQHVVEFRFRPRSVYYGIAVSAAVAGLLLLYAAALAVRERRKRARKETERA